MKRSLASLGVATLAACTVGARSAGVDGYPTSVDDQREASAVRAPVTSPEVVRLAQCSLAGRGFPVDQTGTLDEATRTAIAEFQRSRDLTATGMLNAPTLLALGLDPDAAAAPGHPPKVPRDPASDPGISH
jgi:peptidoglycan hydrolase-like protein with peptidoglycan-binding domain